MAIKPKCSECEQRDVFAKGLCSGCYGRQWREKRRIERGMAEQPKQLTAGESDVIEPEVMPSQPSTHLTALNPAEMQAARGDMKVWLENKLTTIEHDIVEANAAIEEARRNGWATGALVSARNRAVDDETFYNKILIAVDAGHTVIPEFPIEVFAIRRHESIRREGNTWQGVMEASGTYLGEPVPSDCPPAGAGEYQNPQPQTVRSVREDKTPGAQERGEPRYYTTIRRTGRPHGPIFFPSMTARSPLMKATAKAMEEKVFDQIGVCLPVAPDAAARRVRVNAGRAGDPLVIGQILRKRSGGTQRCVSFIIGWYLDLSKL